MCLRKALYIQWGVSEQSIMVPKKNPYREALQLIQNMLISVRNRYPALKKIIQTAPLVRALQIRVFRRVCAFTMNREMQRNSQRSRDL